MESAQITVMGLGYVGISTALTLSYLGHKVVGYDPVEQRVEQLASGESPIYEKSLSSLLNEGLKSATVRFTSDPQDALRNAEFIFVCVGTPSQSTGQADLRYVKSAANMIGQHMTQRVVVINKSTVPVGTGDKVLKWVRESQVRDLPVDVVSNPEFLREGSAVQDSLNPTRIVIGANKPEVGELVSRLFRGLDSPVLLYSLKTAEMIKYASNAFLATKISFINEIANICDRVGADVVDVAEGMGYDYRIGSHFLNAGVGYGGSCFPKDTSALIQIAGDVYYDFKLLKAVVDVNNQARLKVVQILEQAMGTLVNRNIVVLGLSFKPGTDDTRESPALTIVQALLEKGAHVRGVDPVALNSSIRSFENAGIKARIVEGSKEEEVPEVSLYGTPFAALHEADAVLLLTEWEDFVTLDWTDVARQMRGNVIVDGRNVLNASDVRAANLSYYCIGRPQLADRVGTLV